MCSHFHIFGRKTTKNNSKQGKMTKTKSQRLVHVNWSGITDIKAIITMNKD